MILNVIDVILLSNKNIFLYCRVNHSFPIHLVFFTHLGKFGETITFFFFFFFEVFEVLNLIHLIYVRPPRLIEARGGNRRGLHHYCVHQIVHFEVSSQIAWDTSQWTCCSGGHKVPSSGPSTRTHIDTASSSSHVSCSDSVSEDKPSVIDTLTVRRTAMRGSEGVG